MPIITAAIIGAAGSAISGAASASASKKNAQAKLDQQSASARATAEAHQRLINSAISGNYAGGYGLSDIFGDKIEAIPATDLPYEVSANNAQLLGEGLPNALNAAGQINRQVTADSLVAGFDRARATTPGYDDQVAQFNANILSRLQGEIPQDVQDQIATSRASLGASLGTPGGTGPATLKDLGITSLQLQGEGANMFTQFQNTMQQLFPTQRVRGGEELLPYTSLTAQGRVSSAIEIQKAAQQSAIIEAMADPAAEGLFNAENAIANTAGQQLGGSAPSNFGAAIAGGIGQGVSAYGSYLGQQALAPPTPQGQYGQYGQYRY